MCRNCSKRTEECAYAPFPRRRGPGKAPRGSKKTAKIRAVGQMPAPPGYTEFDSKQPTPGPSGLASDESQPLKPGQMKFTTRGSPIAVVEEVAEFREPARTRTETLPRYERVERTPGLYTEPAGQAVLGEKEMDVKYGGRILEGQASFTESPPQNLRSLAEEEV